VTVGVCTDSGAQLPAELAAHLGIEVVPLTVRVAEQEFLEGGDLDADELYEMLSADDGDVEIVPPSPGQCAIAYEQLAAQGSTSIVAVHTSVGGCNSLNAARLAARAAPVPVRIVDCGSLSFGVGCSAWAVAEALRAGASLDEAVQLAETTGRRVDHVFTFGMDHVDGVAGFTVGGGFAPEIVELGRVPTAGEAAAMMAAQALSTDGQLRVGVGAAGSEAVGLADLLAEQLTASARPMELVRYRIGAGVAKRLRPGTVGCFVVPV
jgi:fatty acid-binding protein DegV